MLQFVKKIGVYILLILMIVMIGFLFNKVLINEPHFFKVDQNINKLVIGASRTETSINEDYLKNSMNVSGSADALFFSRIKLELIKKHNPQIDTVFLSLDNRTLNENNNFYEPIILQGKIPRYLYFFSKTDWRDVMNLDLKSSLISLLKTPKFTPKLLKESYINSEKSFEDLNLGGYVKVYYTINQKVIDDFYSKENTNSDYFISEIEKKNLSDISQFCHENNIELIFVNPPLHPIMFNSNKYQKGKLIFDKFLKQHYSTNLNLDFSDQFLPDSCYADLIHLNRHGAKIFSKKLNELNRN